MIRRHHRVLRPQPRAGAAGQRRGGGLRHLRPSRDPARRPAGPLGHAGHHLLSLGPVAGHHRGPGDVPDHQRAPRRAEGEGRPGLLGLRVLVRLRDLRGRDRPLLGAVARHRIPFEDPASAARRRPDGTRAGRHRRRVGVPVRARGPQRHPLARPVALLPGLDRPVRRAVGARCRGGRVDRRLRAAVPDHRRSRAPRVAPASRSTRWSPPFVRATTRSAAA